MEIGMGGDVYISYGNHHGRVLAILMLKYYDHSMEQIIIDDNGRYIVMKACFSPIR
jgi:hypothetical protein